MRTSFVVGLVVTSLVAAAAPADGQLARMVKDINTTAAAASSFPSNFVDVDGAVYFTADDGANRIELWRSDGTAGGTHIVADIYPGAGSSPGPVAVVGRRLLFPATDHRGRHLWASDGTAAGTALLKPFASLSFFGTVQIDGAVYFQADDGTTGLELWKTDGTEAGTVLVKDIRPGAAASNITAMTRVGGTLFFVANDGATGAELWRSDGTSGGTFLVKDISSGGSASSPSFLRELNGALVFAATDPVNGRELWRSDGTSGGTNLLKDILPGPSSSLPAAHTVAGGLVFFVANDGVAGRELWKSDGTSGGTQLVSDLNPGAANGVYGAMLGIGGLLYFGFTSVAGGELWKSDGSAAGTALVADILPGPGSSFPDAFVQFGGRLYFRADNGAAGVELWTSDGTEGGTFLVNDIAPGAASSFPSRFVAVGGLLWLAASGADGNEPWISDGTETGTFEVKDINPGAGSGVTPPITGTGEALPIVGLGDALLFVGNDGEHGAELWTSDGTNRGTRMIADIFPGSGSSSILRLTKFGSFVYFRACSGPAASNDCELWKSDGTSIGTARVKDIRPGVNSGNPDLITDVNGALFFVASVEEGTAVARRLWRTQGTDSSTQVVTHKVSSPVSMANVNGVLYFSAQGSEGVELWATDGTDQGTRLVKDIRPGSASSAPSGLVAVNGQLIFAANDGEHGRELWRSDGTAEGTMLVKDATPGIASTSFGPDLDGVVAGNRFYFIANNGVTGFELWASDGAEAGTAPVRDIAPGPASSFPSNLIVIGETIYFDALEAATGYELWKTDGSSEGTQLVGDFYSGPGASRSFIVTPPDLGDGGKALLFSATDGISGLELWRTDDVGRNPGDAVMLQEIVAGPGSSSPESFTRVGGRIFFTVDDNINGRELWMMPSFAQNLPEPAARSLTAFPGFQGRAGLAPAVHEILADSADEEEALLLRDPDTWAGWNPRLARWPLEQ